MLNQRGDERARTYSQTIKQLIEARQRLNKFRPETLGQASRLSGITPATISLLLIHLKKGNFRGFADKIVGGVGLRRGRRGACRCPGADAEHALPDRPQRDVLDREHDDRNGEDALRVQVPERARDLGRQVVPGPHKRTAPEGAVFHWRVSLALLRFPFSELAPLLGLLVGDGLRLGPQLGHERYGVLPPVALQQFDDGPRLAAQVRAGL